MDKDVYYKLKEFADTFDPDDVIDFAYDAKELIDDIVRDYTNVATGEWSN